MAAPTLADLPPRLQRAIEAAVDKNARAPVVLSVTEITGYTDWVLIVSGRSDKHVASITEGIDKQLRGGGAKPRGKDGFADHSWDLLDYDDFIVHAFYHPVRLHYDLESMWSDAARVQLGLPDEVMDTSDLDALEPSDAMPEYRGDLVFGGYDDEFADDDDDDDDDDNYDEEIDDSDDLAEMVDDEELAEVLRREGEPTDDA